METNLGAGAQPVYLDCAATAPVDPAVADVVMHYLTAEFGNAGSRTHSYGVAAKAAVERARRQVAEVVGAAPEEVVFTSGATEANNLAVLGLAAHGTESGRRHVVSTGIEHKAVLEPLAALERQGFAVDLVAPRPSGAVDPGDVLDAVRDDTLLVSVMHVNNETGIRQPVDRIADALAGHGAFIHVDAAQSYGKELDALRHPRIDLVSVSGHKLYAPKGIGALVARRRDRRRPPLQALLHGGGQERGLRPGTLPVALIAGFGAAAEAALVEVTARRKRCEDIRRQLLEGLQPLEPVVAGDPHLAVPHILNVAFPNLDAEAVILLLRNLVAISNGSACTSDRYEPSHVLRAMDVSDAQLHGAVRLSWSHLTPDPPVAAIVDALRAAA